MANYHLGRDDEYAIMRLAEQAGCAVVRAAGSKGWADVLAFVPDGAHYAINVKRGTWAGPTERLVMARWLDHNVWPVLAKCESGKGRAREWLYRDVSGDGSMGEPVELPPWEWHA